MIKDSLLTTLLAGRSHVRYLIAILVVTVAAGAFYLSPPAPKVDVPEPERRSYKHIKIEVLNGCGVSGLARTVATRLRSLGFDVMTVQNANSFGYPESIVIDRVGSPTEADHVAQALGIPNRIQQIIPDPFRIEGVTVIIGRDYRRMRLVDPVTAAMNSGVKPKL